MKRIAATVMVGLGLLGSGICGTALAQSQAPASRPAVVIETELNDTMGAFVSTLDQNLVMQSAANRKSAAPTVLPLAKKTLALIDELSAAAPRSAPALHVARVRFDAFVLIFGDAQERDLVTRIAASKGPGSITARAIVATADYVVSDGNAEAQLKAIDDYDAALKAAPGDIAICGLTGVFMSVEEPAPAVATRFINVLKTDVPYPEIQQAAMQMEAANNLRLMENKPLVLQGVKLDGTKFSSADWKGKVVLAYFWALWSEPSVDALTDMKKIYAQYHAKGLEVVAISCDKSGDVLRRYLAANADLTWPELFEDKTAGMHPLAVEYGVKSLPTIFLIDRKGILRTVEGTQNMVEMIPKLLDEKAQ
jgi:thiol-disulfide isomerase/thioredoxin